MAEITASDLDEAGSKATRLGELARAGLPVPEGIALTAGAFESFLRANGWEGDLTPNLVASGKLPDGVRKAVLSISQRFGDMLLAVRSSSVSEDLEGASFAGQYETVLGVRGEDELADAIRRCWASAFSPRVATYIHSKGDKHAPRMAVLVQRLVRAEAAGVAFTANPVTGDRNVVVVNSVRGLGERLVSGRASPDEWHVRGPDAVCMASSEQSITAEQARLVAELAKRVETHFGSPQDVEWAVSGETLYLLQARPITALTVPGERVDPVEIPIVVPEGYWAFDEEHFGTPVSPMEASLTTAWTEPATKRACEDLGLPFEGARTGVIGGYLYMRMVPPGGKDRAPPPSWLMPILARVVPQVRTMNKRCVEAVRTDKRGKFVKSWYEELEPTLRRKTHGLSRVGLEDLSDAELQSHISTVTDLYAEVGEAHFKLVMSMALPLWRFSSYCEASLGWDRRRALELLSSNRTGEPSRKLRELADRAWASPVVAELLQEKEGDFMLNLRAAEPRLAEDLSAYLKDYLSLTVGYDVSMRSIDEDPSLLVKLLREGIRQERNDSPQGSAEERRGDLVREARKLTGLKGQEEVGKFDQLLEDADRAYAAIDDTQFYTMKCRGLVRKGVMEMGRRLEKRGILTEREDVFFLGLDEAKNAFQGKETNLLERVTRRKGERAWAGTHPGPRGYGRPPGPPPSTKAFPPEVREVMESFSWMFENVGLGPEGKKGGYLTGLGASSGKYSGPVRLIRDESEFEKARPGDVIVCPTTAPTWTVLFAAAGALVTDMGGLLSHPAIIAREFRIPAVLATRNATQLLHDGEIVTVDGDRGVVVAKASA